MGGTDRVPQDYSQTIADFASHGFHTLGLFYPSTQGQVDCDESRQPPPSVSTNLNCTARQRYRVLTGSNWSYDAWENRTNITTPDSIVNRLSKALAALGSPWSSWLAKDGHPDWKNIVISGHSNGADHAAFLAKTFAVSRALLIAGANDMVGDKSRMKRGEYTQPAPWQYAPGATPAERLYGFGLCGTQSHAASPICFNWRPGWEAQGLPGPPFRVDDVLESKTALLSGYHRLCSNGSMVGASKNIHMASAGDCCIPKFPDEAPDVFAGKIMWTNVFKHMLLDPIGSPPIDPDIPDSCGCVHNSSWRFSEADSDKIV